MARNMSARAAKGTMHNSMTLFENMAIHTVRYTSTRSFYTRVATALAFLIFLTMSRFHPIAASTAGYSYSSFVGPVSGPEERVYVHDRNSGATRLDYVARPEYQFAYGVEDAGARVLHNRREERDGDAVQGMYSVVDPDGTLRVVRYTADNVNGFQAEVITNGVPALHGRPAVDEGVPPVPGQVYHNNNNNNNYAIYPLPEQSTAVRQQPNQYEVHESEGDGDDDGDGDGDDEEEYDESAEQQAGKEEEDADSEENVAYSYEDATREETAHEEEEI